MNIIYENRRFLNLGLNESIPTDYPSDNQGDVTTVEIDVRVDDYVISSLTADPAIAIVIRPVTALTGLIEQKNQLWTSQTTGFATFKVGDEITIKDTGSGGDSGAITAFAAGANTVVTSAAHGRFNGDEVTISGTTSYNGTFTISGVTTNTFTISAVFVADDATGGWVYVDAGFTITRNIIEIVTGQLVLVDVDFDTPPYDKGLTLNDKSVVYYSTPVQSLEFFNGLIENNEAPNYFDKLTDLKQRAKVEGLDNLDLVTEHPMIQLGDNSRKYGTLTVRGNGHGDGPDDPIVSQAFTITQTYVNGPLSRADLVNGIKSGIAPPWLLGNNSLKYVSRMEMSKDINNPNDIKTGKDDAIKGNNGYNNEHLNTGIQNYTVSDVSYFRPDDSVITSIELSTNEQFAKLTVTNLNAPFSDGNTRFVINHFVLHENPDEYRLPAFPDPDNDYPARDRFMKENQLFDRIECTLGVLSVTPDNLGEDSQIIKECDSEFISATEMEITVKFQMAQTAFDRVSAISNLFYGLTVSTANHTLTRALSDKEAPEIDFQPYFVQTTDPTLIKPVNSFIIHTNSDVDAGVQSSVIRPGDDFNGVTIFSLSTVDIPNFDRAGAVIVFTSITAQMIAKKGTDFFVLDEQKETFGTLPVVGGVPEITVQKDVGFASPVDDLRKYWTIKRRPLLDAGGEKYYEINYPTMFRWAYWQQLKGVPAEFYDRDLPDEFFGQNHDWAHYFIGTSWNFYYRITINLTKDGVPQTYTLDSQLLVEDYLQGNEWTAEQIEAFKTDITGAEGDEIVQGLQSGAMQDELTLIRAEKTFSNPPEALPVIGDIEAVFLVSIFEGTNFKGAFLISSLYDKTGNNPWVGLNGIPTVTVTDEGGGVFRAEAILKAGFFDSSQQIRIGARYYDKRAEGGIPDGKTTEAGVLKTDEIGFVKDIE